MAGKSEADELNKKMRQSKAILDDLNFPHQKHCHLGVAYKRVGADCPCGGDINPLNCLCRAYISQTACICDAGGKNKKINEARKLLETGIVLSRDILL